MSSINGIGVSQDSGVYNLVQQYMVLERAQMNRLQAQQDETATRSAAFTDLGSRLRDLRSAVSDFRWSGSLTPLNTFTVSSGDGSVVEAAASGSAAEGHHAVTVSSLARAHSIASEELDGEETSTLAGTHSFQLVQGEESYQISVTIDEGDSNREALSKIVAAINSSGSGVAASLAATDSRTGRFRVLVTSKTTGTGGIISELSDTSGNLATAIGLAGISGEGKYTANTVQAAADAMFTVDGLEFISSSNHVTGALTGFTLTLVGISTAPVSISVERDVEAVTESVQELLDTYNALVDYVRNKTRAADSEGTGRGMLTGDTLFMTLRSRLRTAATGAVTDSTGQSSLQRLSQIGITTTREGRLTVSDADALAAALETNPHEVERLFSDEEQGVAVRLVELVDSYVSAGGLLTQQRQAARVRERALDQRIAREEAFLARREEELTQKLAALQSVLVELSWQQKWMGTMGYA